MDETRKEVQIHKKRHEDAANEIKKLKSIEDNLNAQLQRSKNKRLDVQQERDKVKEELKAVTARARAAAENVIKYLVKKIMSNRNWLRKKQITRKTKDALNGKIMGLRVKLNKNVKT